MASVNESHHHGHPFNGLNRFIQSTASNLSSFLASITASSHATPSSSNYSPLQPLPLLASTSFAESTQPDSLSSRPPVPLSATKSVASESSSGFPSTVRISSLYSNGKGGGPAFMGQVFSMCDLSGTGLMAVSTHFDIPFISRRTPEWLKKMFAVVSKSERNGPVFRFFMDLGDAVSYVKKLDIPSGMVGACRLDLAYEHFKERPHLFQFVPNEKQVKEANKLLKAIPQDIRRKVVDGVPVFSAQNLDIAIATTDGVKWYTPYFFDKNMLDNILEESVDHHFRALIQTRHLQRRRDIVDDNLGADIVDEIGESMWEASEVQEMLDDIGNPGIPLSVVSKFAEIQLLHAVDKVLLGNKWLRKATGIQPKFPYLVDSFERRSAASVQRASKSSNFVSNSELGDNSTSKHLQHYSTSEFEDEDKIQAERGNLDFGFPFGDWLTKLWSKQSQKHQSLLDERMADTTEEHTQKESRLSPLLPQITMVGILTSEGGQMSKAALKNGTGDLTKELERIYQGSTPSNGNGFKLEDRDPLFVANVGNYYPGVARTSAA